MLLFRFFQADSSPRPGVVAQLSGELVSPLTLFGLYDAFDFGGAGGIEAVHDWAGERY